MALPNATVWEVRPGSGADTNGGGFVTGASGTDYSQLNSAQYSLTNGTATTSSATILTVSASADMVGNVAYVAGGTGSITAAWYEIISVSVGTSITVDRSTGLVTGTGVTITVGGALATIGAINTILRTANMDAVGATVWVKATATITTAATITFSPSGGTSTSYCYQINGYTTTRGDGGQVSIANSTGSSITLLSSVANALIVRNFSVNGNSKSSTIGFESQGGNGTQYFNCFAENCTSYGFVSAGSAVVFNNCVVTTSSGTAAFRFEDGNGANYCIDCLAYANSTVGFLGSAGMCIRCSAVNNSGGSSHGFSMGATAGSMTLDHCNAVGNGGDGVHLAGIDGALNIQSCIFYGNTGYAMNYAGTAMLAYSVYNDYNAYGGNTAGELTGGFVAGPHDVALSVGSPFLSGLVVANMITLNNTAGAGAACRGAGFPGLLQFGQLGYTDIGALQSQGGATYVIQKNVTRIFVNEGD